MPDMVRVFVDGTAVEVPRGATALDAVRAADPAAAEAVSAGGKLVTDSRGLPADPAQAVSAGSIYRLVPRRDRATDVEEEL